LTAKPASLARAFIALCLASLCWAFSFGLGAPLASVWLAHAGYGEDVIGWNTGVYYGGIALTAALVPWMMRRWGRSCPVLGMVASGVTVALFPWGGSLPGLFLLRLLNGVAGAMSLIPMETLVNQRAAPEQRSRDFGFYAFSVALGMALGTLVGMFMETDAPRLAFVLGGLAGVLAGVVVLRWLPWTTLPVEQRLARVPQPIGRTFLSWGSAWAQGYLEGGMVGLLPVYLLNFGWTSDGVGFLMGGVMVGVIASQVPLAWLADRLGRTVVLAGCYAVTLAALGALPFCRETGWLTAALFAAGACSGAFYPLGLAVLGERVPSVALPRASACFLAINCVGSVSGPVLTGEAMRWFGMRAMFPAGFAAVALVVAVWLIVWGRERVRGEQQTVETAGERREAA
jgi:MFS family permease